MRAIRVNEHGDAGVLRLEELPEVQPAAGQVRVRVRYAGLNFIDVYQRQGVYPMTLPYTPGNEGAGVVEALGEGVTGLSAGQRVAWNVRSGSFAEAALVPADKLVPVPDGVSDQQAAALMLQGMTAHYLARSTYALSAGDVCLVHAAAGGVGQLLVQIAKLSGATVIATAGSDDKLALARELGADAGINYATQDFETEVRRLTDGAGVHVVYDSVGLATFLKGLNVLRVRGMMVLYGGSSGQVAPIDPQLLNQKGGLFLTRPALWHYTQTRAELLARADELFGWVQGGQLQVHINQVFPLDQTAEAMRYLEARQTRGKVLLSP